MHTSLSPRTLLQLILLNASFFVLVAATNPQRCARLIAVRERRFAVRNLVTSSATRLFRRIQMEHRAFRHGLWLKLCLLPVNKRFERVLFSVIPTPALHCVVDSQCSASTYCNSLNLCASKPCTLDSEVRRKFIARKHLLATGFRRLFLATSVF